MSRAWFFVASAEAVGHFMHSERSSFNGLDPKILNRCTFKSRQDNDQPLDPAESDRVVRIESLVAADEETFDDAEEAHAWLGCENFPHDSETPVSMADPNQGARVVEALLGQIAHGIAA